MNRSHLNRQYLDLIQVLLPSLGRTRQWAVDDEHGFTRVVLDHLFHDAWYSHLDRGLRPHRQLTDTQLAQAVAIAERLRGADAQTVAAMDQQSMAWRDRPTPATVKHHPPRLVRG